MATVWENSMFESLWRRMLAVLAALLVMASFSIAQAKAKVEAHIDLSKQRMTVYVNGGYYASWPVSTARRGYVTPRGTFRPRRLERMHYSRKYHNSPMPHSIFFLGGYAIHGTGAISRLGRPASHGCVRLHPSAAADLYGLVKRYGMRNVRIRITGTPKYTAWPARSRKKWKSKRRHRYRQKINLSRREKARSHRYRLVRRGGRRYLDTPIIYESGLIGALRNIYH